MSSDRPETVYKYESFNARSLMNLKAQSLYFGSPRNFNDPYDCAITATVADPTEDQIEFLRRHFLSDSSLPPAGRRQFESLPPAEMAAKFIAGAEKAAVESREKFLTTNGVTCFSECNDDLLMWAHYGGQYKGFCLAFNTKKDPFTKLRRVKYVDTMPRIDIVDVFVERKNRQLRDLVCTKSTKWAYEREWRALHAEAGTLFGYEADALRGIYFGPDIERQALEIVCLIIRGQNPGVRFYRGTRSESEFRVLFEETSYKSHVEAKREELV